MSPARGPDLTAPKPKSNQGVGRLVLSEASNFALNVAAGMFPTAF